MEIPISDINYVYAAATFVLGILIALITRTIVNWLKTKAGETETQWDDIVIAAIGTPVQVAIVVEGAAVPFVITGTFCQVGAVEAPVETNPCPIVPILPLLRG